MRPPASTNSRELYIAGRRYCAARSTSGSHRRSGLGTRALRRLAFLPCRRRRARTLLNLMHFDVAQRETEILRSFRRLVHHALRRLLAERTRGPQYGNLRRRGYQLLQQCQTLWHSSGPRKVVLVMLPPGCDRLATRPSPTGSPTGHMTMGIDVVACCAARAAIVDTAMVTSTLRRTSSAASVRRGQP
jgi:hypothetical protein